MKEIKYAVKTNNRIFNTFDTLATAEGVAESLFNLETEVRVVEQQITSSGRVSKETEVHLYKRPTVKEIKELLVNDSNIYLRKCFPIGHIDQSYEEKYDSYGVYGIEFNEGKQLIYIRA